MSIRPGNYDMNRNVMTHANVTIGRRYKDYDKVKFQTQKNVYDVIYPLLTARPTWRFVAMDASFIDDKAVFGAFAIYEDGEMLGSIKTVYAPRSNTYKLSVENERIDAKRERGKGYKTESAEKALLSIRKHFFRLGVAERVEKVRTEAVQCVHSEHSSKSYDLRRAESSLLCESDTFAKSRMDEYLTAHPHLKPALEEYTTKHEYYMVIDNVKTLLDNHEALIVVLDKEHYIVVQGADTKTYDSDTLPYHLREKVGLLKLVTDHQMISGVGCRVSAEAFVVLPESEVKEQSDEN
jgi:hypothetical protein